MGYFWSQDIEIALYLWCLFPKFMVGGSFPEVDGWWLFICVAREFFSLYILRLISLELGLLKADYVFVIVGMNI